MELPEKKLSDAELDVMLAVWQNRPPVLRSDLEEQLKSHNWADTTVLTLLSKLVEKGYLSLERQGRRNLYTPLVSERDYRRWANRSFLGKMYQSSLRRMVASLVESSDLTDRDLQELEEFITEQRAARENERS
jgi:transcriptional repressor